MIQPDLLGGNGLYRKGEKHFWRIPPEIYNELDREFHFDFDPCPYPATVDGTEIEWGQSNWVNPPFTKRDRLWNHGATAFARKAVMEQQKGKTAVFIMPVSMSIFVLLQAKPEIRPIGAVEWVEAETGERSTPSRANVLFILRGVE